MNSILIKELSLQDEGIEYELAYYRLEENLSDCQKSYGVRIDMKKTCPDTESSFDTKSVFNVFHSEKPINDFLDILVAGYVTPTTLDEITKEYITDLLYVK